MQGKNDRQWPFWRYNCESCMKCAAFCPQNAIEAGHSWGVLLGLILSWPAAAWLLSKLSTWFPGVETLVGTWMYRIIELAGFYLVLTLSYMVFSRLLRIPFINQCFTLTTFTHLPAWGRYREPETRLKHLRDDKSEKKPPAN
ncbi:hypothetical protein KKI24_20670 [bacterium]|nr:hypothetical protein [bacterium]